METHFRQRRPKKSRDTSQLVRTQSGLATAILVLFIVGLNMSLPAIGQSTVIVQGVFHSNAGDQQLNPNNQPNAASSITPLINSCNTNSGFTGTNCTWPITASETNQWPDPDLSFSVAAPYNTSSYNVTWKMVARFSDDCVVKKCNAAMTPMSLNFSSTTTGDQFWSPLQSNPLPPNAEFGGDIIVQAQVKSVNSCDNGKTGTLTFKVLGATPDPQAQVSFMAAQWSSSTFGRVLWFLPNLINQESLARQFNPSTGRPQFGDPDDNGVMQIDRLAQSNLYAGNNEDPYWNFSANVRDGMLVLQDKQQNSAVPCNTNQGEVTDPDCEHYAYDFWDRQVFQACVASGGSGTAIRNGGLGTETCNVAVPHPQYPAGNPSLPFCTAAMSWSDQNPAGHWQDIEWMQLYNGAPCGYFLFWNNPTKSWSFRTEACGVNANYVVAVCQRAPAYH